MLETDRQRFKKGQATGVGGRSPDEERLNTRASQGRGVQPPLNLAREMPDGGANDPGVDLPPDAGGDDGAVTKAQHRLAAGDGLADLFEVAKELVDEHLDASRVGIMVGLQSLGVSPNGFLGGYYVTGSNAIVLNRDVLAHVQANHPRYENAYAFHILLHEYLHSLGYLDEATVRRHALEISQAALGPDHPATRIAAAMAPGADVEGAPELFRKLTMPPYGWTPDDAGRIEYVRGVDRDATDYIA